MTTTSNSECDCAELTLTLLEWLEDREHDGENGVDCERNGDDERDGEKAAGNVPSEAIDDAFDLLSSERRRLFLQVMRTYGEAITLPDAAEEVAVRETGDAVRELSAERVANVYISLYHDHLPRLVDAGLLEYDQERDLVSPARLRERADAGAGADAGTGAGSGSGSSPGPGPGTGPGNGA
ncbi:hypothetical protein C446_02382 [Halobiforma nitratireducens JCM 10879]|uniref:DUF7344 domain-containing protein n=1 Tax=Halobiforma nitratireducens JCM 10879 TaxID=1227454 RepID=M0MKJ9_9EURY|nr:hypothetical protein C446_02382 [Halobiforma nitratireducens JCM 10879]